VARDLLALLDRGEAGLTHILVVDDNRSVRAALRVFLEEEGFEVQVACDFEAAARMLREAAYDVLITDLDLPGGNGFDLVRRARAFRPEMRSILVTGYGCSALRRQAAELDLLGYLEKPVDPFTLLSLVRARETPLGEGRHAQ